MQYIFTLIRNREESKLSHAVGLLCLSISDRHVSVKPLAAYSLKQLSVLFYNFFMFLQTIYITKPISVWEL